MVRLDDARVSSAQMHPEIRRAVGDPRDLGPEPPAWGWWVEGQIVALADTMVRWGQVASVQQVFTAPDLRRQGHSAALISAMMASPAVQGLTLTWLASAANTPSIRLAERLGFVDPQELAFVEERDR